MLPNVDSSTLLVLELATECYGLAVSEVRGIVRWRAATPLPGTPPALMGVIHQRGAVLPVVDMRPLLGLPAVPPTGAFRLVLVEAHGVAAALLAEKVRDVWTPPADAPVSAPTEGPNGPLVRSLVRWDEQPVAILELAAIWAALTTH